MNLNYIKKLVDDTSLTRSHLLVLNYLNLIKSFKGTQLQLAELLNLNIYTLIDALAYLNENGYIKKTKPQRGDERLRRIEFVKGITE